MASCRAVVNALPLYADSVVQGWRAAGRLYLSKYGALLIASRETGALSLRCEQVAQAQAAAQQQQQAAAQFAQQQAAGTPMSPEQMISTTMVRVQQ